MPMSSFIVRLTNQILNRALQSHEDSRTCSRPGGVTIAGIKIIQVEDLFPLAVVQGDGQLGYVVIPAVSTASPLLGEQIRLVQEELELLKLFWRQCDLLDIILVRHFCGSVGKYPQQRPGLGPLGCAPNGERTLADFQNRFRLCRRLSRFRRTGVLRASVAKKPRDHKQHQQRCPNEGAHSREERTFHTHWGILQREPPCRPWNGSKCTPPSPFHNVAFIDLPVSHT